MSCYELEALRLGLLNVLGIERPTVREHALAELDGHRDGPIDALANAESLAEIERHLDSALVGLEATIADTPSDDPEFAYLNGRLLAVRNAEQSIRRVRTLGAAVLDDCGGTHDLLHDAFPADE